MNKSIPFWMESSRNTKMESAKNATCIEEFESFDLLNLKPFAERLEKFISSEKLFVEGSLVLSLQASFGSGKSTFLRMWKSDLEARRQSNLSLPIPVILNAWETDYAGDPLLALLEAINRLVDEHENELTAPKGATRLKEATADAANFAIGMANSFVAHATGLDPVKAGDYAKEMKSHRSSKAAGKEILEEFSRKKTALSNLKSALAECFGNQGKEVLFLVDELDRCRPDYAVSYLETIKHIFDVQGLTFILALDRAQLECSAKALFGQDLNFPEYYRKFAHRNIEMPPMSNDGISKITMRYIERFVEDPHPETPKRKTLLDNAETSFQNLKDLAAAFCLTPRQMQEAMRIIGHLAEKSPAQQGKLYWGIGYGLLLMAILNVGDPELFSKISTRTFSVTEVAALAKKITQRRNHQEWWTKLILIGICRAESQEEYIQFLNTAQKCGAIPPEISKEDLGKYLSEHAGGWGDFTTTKLAEIGGKISSLQTFGG
ncbi:MAG: hypothetical protein D4R65_13260 [Verrucomicrobiaceae bacterium]|nr:MAG: hypothetical protein D4R65_13260 [Verrucomicrobiaceae bacterium]